MVGASPFNGSGATGASATDAAGNVYVAGIYFGSLGFGSTTLAAPDARGEFYVAKLSPAGQWLWAVRTGATAQPTGLVVDAAGTTLTLTGTFTGTATFGATALTSGGTSGTSDIFVARLATATGQWDWAVQAGSSGNDTGRGVALDAAGNAVITCAGRNAIVFGTFTVGGTVNDAGYVAKLSPAGQWLWALRTSYDSNVPPPVVDPLTGTVTVAGSMSGGTFGTITLPSSAGAVFVGQISAAGQWTQVRGGGTGAAVYQVYALAVDAAGNAVVAGSYGYGAGQFGAYVLPSPSTSSDDVFVARLSAAGQWTWARRAGGSGPDVARAVAVDAAGNAYCTGYFSDNATFGAQVLVNPNYSPSSAPRQIFAGRLAAATGQWDWAVAGSSLGGSYDFGYTLALDPTGRVIIGGGVLNNYTLGGTTAYAANLGVPYQAQLNGGTGALNWLAAAEGQGPRSVTAMATDAAGNVLVAGYFFGTLTLGATTLQRDLLRVSYLAKRSPAGQWLWAVPVGGLVRGLAVVPGTNDVVLTGEISESTGGAFGALTLAPTPNGQYTDVYVAKITAAGQWLWAARAGGPDTDRCFAVSVNAAGAITVAGSYYGGATFGSLAPAGPANNGSSDGFVAQLSAAGQWQWVRRLSGQITETTRSLAATPDGGTLVAGYFQSTTLTFGGPGALQLGTRGPTSGPIALISDGFLAKIDAAGTWQWATGMGGNQYDEATAVASDAQGNAYVAGFYNSATASFDYPPGPVLVLNNAASGAADGFVAKFDPAGTAVWATRASGVGSEQLTALAADATGGLYVGGAFSGSASTYGASVLQAAGQTDAVVGKLSATGQWLWARRAGGGAQDNVTALAYDPTTGALHAGGTTLSRQPAFGAISLAVPSERYESAFLASIGGAGPVTTLAVGPAQKKEFLSVWPNPRESGQPVQLRLPGNGPTEISAYDGGGRLLLHRAGLAVEGVVLIPEAMAWPTGLYLLRAQQGNKQYSSPLICR